MSAIHALRPVYAAVAFAIGILVGMIGIGGGSLMTPILILLFGMHPTTAVGTDLRHAAACDGTQGQKTSMLFNPSCGNPSARP